MRWGRITAAVFLALALVACGGGKKSNSATAGSSSNGSSVGVPSGSADQATAASTDGASPDAQSSDDQSQTEQAAGGGDQGGGGSTDAPAPPGLKPFAGHYTYNVTGQGDPQQIVLTIEDVSDTDQRTTTPASGPSGEQLEVLRYLGDRIELESLEMKGAFPKTFNGPAVFAPIPPTVGASWSWDLTSTDHLTHLHQASKVDRTETVTVGGQAVDTFVVETDITITGDINATGHLTSWASMVYKLAVRSHSVLNVTTPAKISSDITMDLLDLRPS